MRRDVCDESVAVAPEGEVITIAGVAVDGDVGFARVGVGEYDGCVGALEGGCDGGEVVVVAYVGVFGAVTGVLGLGVAPVAAKAGERLRGDVSGRESMSELIHG